MSDAPDGGEQGGNTGHPQRYHGKGAHSVSKSSTLSGTWKVVLGNVFREHAIDTVSPWIHFRRFAIPVGNLHRRPADRSAAITAMH
ncbi:hypothetical protein AB0F85_13645 [Nocardia fluminea]|uniref:hypothetical protein n=1 Tax=Nocardia fluminea TaxID=134984 RepID=UPI0033F0E339